MLQRSCMELWLRLETQHWETHTQHNVHDKKHHNVAIDGGRSRKSKSVDRAVQEIWQNSCN